MTIFTNTQAVLIGFVFETNTEKVLNMKKRLKVKGILKYNSSDKYHYYICECRINTIVDANAPV